MTNEEILKKIEEAVDNMMVNFLSALVQVGVEQVKIHEAIALLMEQADDDA